MGSAWADPDTPSSEVDEDQQIQRDEVPSLSSIGFDRKSHCHSVSACRLRNASQESSLDWSPGSGVRPASTRMFLTVCRDR
jgi:hypothetical protein